MMSAINQKHGSMSSTVQNTQLFCVSFFFIAGVALSLSLSLSLLFIFFLVPFLSLVYSPLLISFTREPCEADPRRVNNEDKRTVPFIEMELFSSIFMSAILTKDETSSECRCIYNWMINLVRFDAKMMLEKLRDKRLVFVGDSIGRNQWESLLCMLSSVVKNKESIYEVNGSPITKHKGFLIFKFKDYNCTVEYYRAPFLVLQSRPPAGSPEKIKSTLKLDQMDWTSWKWRDADVLVFNTGHWWNYEKTIRGGCYFQEGAEVRSEMNFEDAYQKSMVTVLNWIRNEVDTSKTQVIFRTFAPVHFRGGDWRTGGNCHLETLPELGSSLVPSETWVQFKIVADVLSARTARTDTLGVMKLDVLNVTLMTARRKDGHSSLYYLGPKEGPAPLHRQDCSHWCLPGVPDSWNELLYALFLKRRSAPMSSNSSTYSAQV